MATRITTNGKPGESEVQWGWLEKGIVGLMFTLLASGIVGNIVMYGELQAMKTDVTSIHHELDIRVKLADEQHKQYATHEELALAIATMRPLQPGVTPRP